MLHRSKRALPPGILEVLPRLAIVPAVSIGPALCAILAELVDNGGGADDGLKAIRLAYSEACHLTAVAVTNQGKPLRIDRKAAYGLVHARHDVEKVAAAEIVLVCRLKGRAITGAPAGIGFQHG